MYYDAFLIDSVTLFRQYICITRKVYTDGVAAEFRSLIVEIAFH
jgi:hypothetical protein